MITGVFHRGRLTMRARNVLRLHETPRAAGSTERYPQGESRSSCIPTCGILIATVRLTRLTSEKLNSWPNMFKGVKKSALSPEAPRFVFGDISCQDIRFLCPPFHRFLEFRSSQSLRVSLHLLLMNPFRNEGIILNTKSGRNY